ncbi:ribbon-helix-helix domain-containing protein [Chamaesiphon sp. VAR_48_metabat_135_sub]|jgi:metal-responsive CopG/Arc/MetJ family transcriptional regulator|uniref:ribbon-helix-helix domain-containing protein n=1 Tax=Chamaesiphon sp. VAR_48_metabat_135_sub TaxID=2964699 RepID=UPI00286B8587|nr:ribbon-helix-helix domain-containing protein [Chamaesiphon sp. VAR_48_metabat_135_sub]
MATNKVAITIDSDLLSKVDLLVSQRVFPNRSKAIQEALTDKLSLLRQTRLASECAKLDPQIEQQLAEEGIEGDLAQWPTY